MKFTVLALSLAMMAMPAFAQDQQLPAGSYMLLKIDGDKLTTAYVMRVPTDQERERGSKTLVFPTTPGADQYVAQHLVRDQSNPITQQPFMHPKMAMFGAMMGPSARNLYLEAQGYQPLPYIPPAQPNHAPMQTYSYPGGFVTDMDMGGGQHVLSGTPFIPPMQH